MNINENKQIPSENQSKSSYVVTLLLAFFLGCFGAHRFYTGYVGIGIAQLVCTLLGLTAPISALWALVDLISISLNQYTDSQGNELEGPNPGCGLIVLIFIGFSFIFAVIWTLVVLSSSSK